MAMRDAKKSDVNVTAEIQTEGKFNLALELVMENAANGGISMKFAGGGKHKWFNNRLQSDAALENMDSVAHALGLKGWDDEDVVASFKDAIGKVVTITVISKRANGTTYYNVAKIEAVEAKPAAKGPRAAKASDKPFDGDIPF